MKVAPFDDRARDAIDRADVTGLSHSEYTRLREEIVAALATVVTEALLAPDEYRAALLLKALE